MRFSARYLCTVLLTTLSLPTLLAAQATTPQTSKTPRSSVSGRITIKEKGFAGVVVGLRKSENIFPSHSFQRATTDQDGNYHFANVAPGSYEIIPSAPAYVMTQTREIRGKQLLVGDDENVDGVNFSMVRGGVITGRVTDADGRPVILMQVNIYDESAFNQTPPPQQQRYIYPVTNVQTDDRGIYRVFGLQPGRYKVGSGRNDDTFTFVGNSYSGRAMYRHVFYPNVTEQDKAKVIEVTEGSEATDVDITLGRELQTFTATGRVVEGDKAIPVSNLRFMLQRSSGQRSEFVNANVVVTNKQGDFVAEGLIPGKYGIYLFPNQPVELRADPISFEIVDQDVSGVTVRLAKGASVSGVVVLETENKAAFAKFAELQLRGFIPPVPGAGGVVVSSATSSIGPDGSFRLAGLTSGALNISLGGLNLPFPPKGFNIARIERDGISVVRVEIKDGEDVTGVRVVLSYGSAVLRGVVTLDGDPLPPGIRASLRLVKPGEVNPSINLRPPVVDERGHFLIEGIPAGTYELTVFVGTTSAPASPARIAKRTVTIQDGTTSDITVAVESTVPSRP